ncbi:MAG: HAD family hydrolase [Acidiferrobacterales bacterium]
MNQKKSVVAAFDFDGTLTTRDTLIPFLFHSVGAVRFLGNMIRSGPTLFGYGIRLLPNEVAKERMLVNFLEGLGRQKLESLGRLFAREVIPGMVRKRAMDRLKWHQAQGHLCVIISASLDVYLKPWADSVGVENVLCTSLEVDDSDNLTGRLATANCFGAEKRRRLQEWLGDSSRYCLYAYGDSRGDRELLEMADHSFYRSMPGPTRDNINKPD